MKGEYGFNRIEPSRVGCMGCSEISGFAWAFQRRSAISWVDDIQTAHPTKHYQHTCAHRQRYVSAFVWTSCDSNHIPLNSFSLTTLDSNSELLTSIRSI